MRIKLHEISSKAMSHISLNKFHNENLNTKLNKFNGI